MFIKNSETKLEFQSVHFPDRSNVQKVTEWFTLLARMYSIDFLRGSKTSKLAGKSLDFRNLREYEPGDDFRHVDWKASARMGKWLTRQFHQGVNYHLSLILDTNPGMNFGSGAFTKMDSLILLTTFLAWVSYYCGSKLQIFNPRQFQRPLTFDRLQAHNPLQIAKILLTTKKNLPVNWQNFWKTIHSKSRVGNITFFLSDFWKTETLDSAPTITKSDHFYLARITDQGETYIPLELETYLANPETREIRPIVADNDGLVKFKKNLADHSEKIKNLTNEKNMRLIPLVSGEGIIDEFVRHTFSRPAKSKAIL